MISRVDYAQESQDAFSDMNFLIKTKPNLDGVQFNQELWQFFFQQESPPSPLFWDHVYHQTEPKYETIIPSNNKDEGKEEISQQIEQIEIQNDTMKHKKTRKKGQSKDSAKHYYPNMASRVHSEVFKTFQHQDRAQAYCQRKGWNLKALKEEFQFANFSPSTMAGKYQQNTAEHRQIYSSLFQAMLRKRYMLSILTSGKMGSIPHYAKFKKYLLYFANHFQ